MCRIDIESAFWDVFPMLGVHWYDVIFETIVKDRYLYVSNVV